MMRIGHQVAMRIAAVAAVTLLCTGCSLLFLPE